jgi:hypothetical protein
MHACKVCTAAATATAIIELLVCSSSACCSSSIVVQSAQAFVHINTIDCSAYDKVCFVCARCFGVNVCLFARRR